MQLLETPSHWGTQTKKGIKNPWHVGEIYFAYQVFLNTGIRLGELCALLWGDLETQSLTGSALSEPRLRISKTLLAKRDAKGMNILQNFTKGKLSRNVPVNASLQEVLLQWKRNAEEYGYDVANDARVFPIAESYQAFKSLCRRVAKASGLPVHKQGAHTCRHSVATNLVDQGVGLSSVQRVLGHQNQATTEKYVHALGLDQTGVTQSLNWTSNRGSFCHTDATAPGETVFSAVAGSNVIPLRRAK